MQSALCFPCELVGRVLVFAFLVGGNDVPMKIAVGLAIAFDVCLYEKFRMPRGGLRLCENMDGMKHGLAERKC